jgi:hypothetical protein
MPSNYASFTVKRRDLNGVIADVGAGVDVEVSNVTTGLPVAESPLTTAADGVIAAGTFAAVDAGTRVRFRVENEDGLANSATQVTT